MPNNEHRSPRSEAPAGPSGSAAPPPTVDAIIVGGNDETRLLLRGLLRLHHHRVLGEVRTADLLEPSDAVVEARVLILVADGNTEEWPHELATARERQPGVRTLLVVPESSTDLEARARSAGVRGILHRPFAIRDLISTVEAVGRGEERFGPTLPQR